MHSSFDVVFCSRLRRLRGTLNFLSFVISFFFATQSPSSRASHSASKYDISFYFLFFSALFTAKLSICYKTVSTEKEKRALSSEDTGKRVSGENIAKIQSQEAFGIKRTGAETGRRVFAVVYQRTLWQALDGTMSWKENVLWKLNSPQNWGRMLSFLASVSVKLHVTIATLTLLAAQVKQSDAQQNHRPNRRCFIQCDLVEVNRNQDWGAMGRRFGGQVGWHRSTCNCDDRVMISASAFMVWSISASATRKSFKLNLFCKSNENVSY